MTARRCRYSSLGLCRRRISGAGRGASSEPGTDGPFARGTRLERDLLAERLIRLAGQLREMRESLRRAGQEIQRLGLAREDELVAQYRRAVAAVLDLDQAAWQRLSAAYPGHLLADRAPRESEAIRHLRRESLGAN